MSKEIYGDDYNLKPTVTPAGLLQQGHERMAQLRAKRKLREAGIFKLQAPWQIQQDGDDQTLTTYQDFTYKDGTSPLLAPLGTYQRPVYMDTWKTIVSIINIIATLSAGTAIGEIAYHSSETVRLVASTILNNLHH